jgi:hypothetical protein
MAAASAEHESAGAFKVLLLSNWAIFHCQLYGIQGFSGPNSMWNCRAGANLASLYLQMKLRSLFLYGKQ